ncbi:Glutamic acid-rich protein [Caenorhabditis elegans]|uniref:Glutamic acid-rich protein n=1 Tax=Caenorhabditis elegans TaxID=6239 RepID=G5EET4_CAEEL|nr:Glutamic acid-rich protein [Caenorhabditis elegans]CAB01191.1 Glutamic acid-rich protein [Caenorhabditis elegans]|eukprot:NP_506538.1 Uncharacterized protein CELE_F40G12.11 [Caenorhabditis elegans]
MDAEPSTPKQTEQEPSALSSADQVTNEPMESIIRPSILDSNSKMGNKQEDEDRLKKDSGPSTSNQAEQDPSKSADQFVTLSRPTTLGFSPTFESLQNNQEDTKQSTRLLNEDQDRDTLLKKHVDSLYALSERCIIFAGVLNQFLPTEKRRSKTDFLTENMLAALLSELITQIEVSDLRAKANPAVGKQEGDRCKELVSEKSCIEESLRNFREFAKEDSKTDTSSKLDPPNLNTLLYQLEGIEKIMNSIQTTLEANNFNDSENGSNEVTPNKSQLEGDSLKEVPSEESQIVDSAHDGDSRKEGESEVSEMDNVALDKDLPEETETDKTLVDEIPLEDLDKEPLDENPLEGSPGPAQNMTERNIRKRPNSRHDNVSPSKLQKV